MLIPVSRMVRYCINISGRIARGFLSQREANTSSTFREFSEILLLLKSCQNVLNGIKIKHHTDNQNVEQILKVGCRKKHKYLYDEAIEIHKFFRKNNILVTIASGMDPKRSKSTGRLHLQVDRL